MGGAGLPRFTGGGGGLLSCTGGIGTLSGTSSISLLSSSSSSLLELLLLSSPLEDSDKDMSFGLTPPDATGLDFAKGTLCKLGSLGSDFSIGGLGGGFTGGGLLSKLSRSVNE